MIHAKKIYVHKKVVSKLNKQVPISSDSDTQKKVTKICCAVL